MKKQIFAVLAIALVVIGSAFAITVNYLSNQTTATAQVESPILASVSNDDTTFGASADIGTVYGGDTKSLYVKTVNQANNAINGAKLEINLAGLSCAEVSSSLGTCADNAGTATISVSNDYATGETKDQNVALTFVPNLAPGAYSATAQVLYG